MSASDASGRRCEPEKPRDLSPQESAALTECMTVLRVAPDLYSVTTQSGREYTVDAREPACECPWAFYNPSDTCKHAERVAYATEEKAIPAWVDESAVDPLLGRFVSD